MDAGFNGTGNIDNPMARNVIKARHRLVVRDPRNEVSAAAQGRKRKPSRLSWWGRRSGSARRSRQAVTPP